MGLSRWFSHSAWEVDKLRKQQAQQFAQQTQFERNRLAWEAAQAQIAQQQAAQPVDQVEQRYQQGWADGWRAGYDAARAELQQQHGR